MSRQTANPLVEGLYFLVFLIHETLCSVCYCPESV